ncbi:MAG: ArnT family glycosyltransferase [Chloroflexota bacterium]
MEIAADQEGDIILRTEPRQTDGTPTATQSPERRSLPRTERISESTPNPSADWWASGLAILRREWLIVSVLLVAGTLIRLPYLWDVPRFTDELQEVLWSLAIFRGDILPLTAVDSYYGPIWSYLLAASFQVEALGGDLVLVPRIVVMLLAVATIGVSYVLGREIAGRRAALITAALMVTSGGHIIINSHTARSNSVTPLLTTLLVWIMVRMVRSGDGRLLVPAGFLYALALQTHVSVIGLAPGLALGLLLLRPRLMISPWLVAGIGAFLVGYWNMIWFNIQNGFWSLVHARALQQGYSGGHSIDVGTYLTNLHALLESLSRLVSGTIDEAGNPAAVVYLTIALAGLILLAGRGRWLPLLICLSTALVLPYFNPRYGPILSGRYIVPLLPLLYLGLAVTIETVAARLPGLTARHRQLVVALAAVLLVVFPLGPLAFYYREVLSDERTNWPLYQLRQSVASAYRQGDLVLLDEGMGQESLTAGGTDLKAMRMILEADSIPYQVAKLTTSGMEDLTEDNGRVLTIMGAKKVDQFDQRYEVRPFGQEVESASGSGHEYGVYEVGQRQTAPGPAFAGQPERASGAAQPADAASDGG